MSSPPPPQQQQQQHSQRQAPPRSPSRPRQHHNRRRHNNNNNRSRSPSRHSRTSRHHHRPARSRDRRTSNSYRASSPPPPPLAMLTPEQLKEEEEKAKLRDAKCVFVTQLQTKATEDDIELFFSSVCKVVEVALIKEKQSGRSKGFGFVELATFEDVKNALLLSGLPFLWRDGTKGLPLTVRPSEANRQYTEHGAVMVTSNKQHQQLLRGNRLSTSNTDHTPAPAHEIVLIEKTGAGSARALVDGVEYILPTHRGRPMYTKILFVGNLDRSLTDKDLKQVFQAFGPVESVQIKQDVETKESKGFAFVRYEDVACAANANDKLNGFELMGLKLTCNPVNDKVLNARHVMVDDDSNELLIDSSSTLQNMGANRRLELMGKLGGGAAQEYMPKQPVMMLTTATETTPTSRRLKLNNMFDSKQLEDAQLEMELERDTREECERFGRVISCVVDRDSQSVLVTFGNTADAARCFHELQGRWFNMKQISVEFVPE